MVGLGYFPVDVNWDDKLASIEMMFGNDGTKWILEFWKAAYKTNEGVVCFKNPLDLLHASKCRISLERHKEILFLAVSVKFCMELENGSDIYTSNGIQKRIAQILKDRREAKERKLDKERNKINRNGKEWVHCSVDKPDSSGEQSILRANNELSDRITTEQLPENEETTPADPEYVSKEVEKAKLIMKRIDELRKKPFEGKPIQEGPMPGTPEFYKNISDKIDNEQKPG